MFNLIAWCVFGLIAGAIARFLVPGENPMGCLPTMALGLVGSVVGGYLATMIFGGGAEIHAGGLIASVVGAVLVLLLYRQLSRNR